MKRHVVISGCLAAAFSLVALGQWLDPAEAAPPAEIRVDWATYNPVSIVLKDKQLLEQEFAKDSVAAMAEQWLDLSAP